VALQRTGYELTLTVREIADRQASYYRKRFELLPIIDALALRVSLSSRIGALSEGTRHRADLLFALVGALEVLFLDEPTAGLDPVARRDVLSLLRSLCEEEKILTSNRMYGVFSSSRSWVLRLRMRPSAWLYAVAPRCAADSGLPRFYPQL